MSNNNESNYTSAIRNIINQIQTYYTWFVPWFCIVFELFALGVLFLRKPSQVDKTNIIYLYKWQYIIGTIYVINMIFNDFNFSYLLFGYNLTSNMSDLSCKITYFLRNYIYCLPSWMQVIFAFDRFWSICLSRSIKFKRTKRNLTILILSVFAIVAVSSIVYLWYGANLVIYQILNNGTITNTSVPKCTNYSYNYGLAQNIIFNLFQSLIPVILMFSLSIVLIVKIKEVKRKVAISADSRGQQKNENKFTVAVFLINISFLVLHIPYVIYYLIAYCITLYNLNQTASEKANFNLYQKLALLTSYIFTLLEFWRDLWLNRIFREEVFKFVQMLVGKIKSNF